MEYKIKISEIFLEQIHDILSYLDNDIKNLNSSNNLRKRIKESFNIIKRFPKIYPKTDKTDRSNRIYRKITIHNYIILYTIIEIDRVIFISNV